MKLPIRPIVLLVSSVLLIMGVGVAAILVSNQSEDRPAVAAVPEQGKGACAPSDCRLVDNTCTKECTAVQTTCQSNCTNSLTSCVEGCTAVQYDCNTDCNVQLPACQNACLATQQECDADCNTSLPSCQRTCGAEQASCNESCFGSLQNCQAACWANQVDCDVQCTAAMPLCQESCASVSASGVSSGLPNRKVVITDDYIGVIDLQSGALLGLTDIAGSQLDEHVQNKIQIGSQYIVTESGGLLDLNDNPITSVTIIDLVTGQSVTHPLPGNFVEQFESRVESGGR